MFVNLIVRSETHENLEAENIVETVDVISDVHGLCRVSNSSVIPEPVVHRTSLISNFSAPNSDLRVACVQAGEH